MSNSHAQNLAEIANSIQGAIDQCKKCTPKTIGDLKQRINQIKAIEWSTVTATFAGNVVEGEGVARKEVTKDIAYRDVFLRNLVKLYNDLETLASRVFVKNEIDDIHNKIRSLIEAGANPYARIPGTERRAIDVIRNKSVKDEIIKLRTAVKSTIEENQQDEAKQEQDKSTKKADLAKKFPPVTDDKSAKARMQEVFLNLKNAKNESEFNNAILSLETVEKFIFQNKKSLNDMKEVINVTINGQRLLDVMLEQLPRFDKNSPEVGIVNDKILEVVANFGATGAGTTIASELYQNPSAGVAMANDALKAGLEILQRKQESQLPSMPSDAATPSTPAPKTASISTPPESEIHAQTSPKHYDVMVSGTGPVGLACAYEALKQGKSVAVINNRGLSRFDRVQRIFLDEGSRNYLCNLFPVVENNQLHPEDQRFFHELINSTTIEVRDIESFLYRRIQSLNLPPEQYREVTNSEIKSIDMQNGTLKIGEAQRPDVKITSTAEESYSFTNIIGADGARHPSADILNKGLDKADQITYSDIPGPKHPYHASIQIVIRKKDGTPLKLSDKQFIEVATKDSNDSSIQYLSGISLNESKKSNNVRCTFGGEVPEHVFNAIQKGNARDKPDAPNATSEEKEAKKKQADARREQGRQEATAYLKEVMTKYLIKQGMKPEEINKLEFEIKLSKKSRQKDILKVQSFQTSLQRASRAVHEEKEHGRRFILTGDAYRIPNYQYGHGLNHGFLHAQAAGKLIGGEINSKKYNRKCKQLSTEIARKTTILHRLDKLGTKILLYFGNDRPDRIRQQFKSIATPFIVSTIHALNDYKKRTTFPINEFKLAKLMKKCRDAKSNQDLADIICKAIRKAESSNYPGQEEYVRELNTLIGPMQRALLQQVLMSGDSPAAVILPPLPLPSIPPQPMPTDSPAATTILPPMPPLPSIPSQPDVNIAANNSATPSLVTSTLDDRATTVRETREAESRIFKAFAIGQRPSGQQPTPLELAKQLAQEAQQAQKKPANDSTFVKDKPQESKTKPQISASKSQPVNDSIMPSDSNNNQVKWRKGK